MAQKPVINDMNAPSFRLLGTAAFLYIAELCLALLSAPLSVRLFCGIAALHFTWRACTFREGSTHPIGLYLLTSGIYVFAALTEVAMFGNRLSLNPERMGDLAEMGAGFLFCAGIGYTLVRDTRPPRNASVRIDQIAVLTSNMVCTALFMICLIMTLRGYGFGIGNVSRADIYADENSLLSLVRGILALALGVAAAILVAYERSHGQPLRFARFQLFLTLVAYVSVDLLILGDRRLPMMAILSVATNFLPKRLNWRQVLIGSFAVFTFIMYGFVRNTPPSQWMSIISSGDVVLALSPASNEFGGMSIIGEAIYDFDRPAGDFPTYHEAFLQLVPKAILNDRPLSPTEWFARVYYPELATVGASFAFNQVIEAKLNAGIVGLVLAGFLTGAAIALCSRIRYSGVLIGIPIAVYIFTFSMRMDFASLLRTMIVAAIGLLIIIIPISLMRLERALKSERHGIV